MDDGDHSNAVEENAAAAEDAMQYRVHPESRFQNDEAHLEPTRWWFASSAFPMIAGTLGPVASAFSICSLSRYWRQHLPPGARVVDATFIKDPAWLTIINAMQLGVALISNAFLLLNMAKRVRFTIAQPITIVGWYISAICLLSLNATAASPLRTDLHGVPVEEMIWSQAFYYSIWSAILYFIDASFMAVTFWGANAGHYSRDFNLTPSQRTLMLQTIMFLMYLLLGALVFCTIEGWNYLDGVYWADVTLFTVGFGDFHVTKPLARALLFPYALIGVISLGLVISSIRSMVLERGRRRLDARIEEKNRRRVIRSMTSKGLDDVITPVQRQPTFDDPPPAELDRRRSEFELMRKIQEKSSVRRRWMALATSSGSWLILWLLGAYVFMKCEEKYQGWTYFDAFYFCFVSFTTIGYGDVTPTSNAGKSFFVFWSLLALPTMTVLLSSAGDTVVKFIREATITVGNVTILPDEQGFSRNIKYVMNQLTCGMAFSSVESISRDVKRQGASDDKTPPNAYKLKDKLSNGDVEKGTQTGADSAEASGSPQGIDPSADGHSLNPVASHRRKSLSYVRDRLDNLPTGHDFHLVLISEIQAVARHFHEPRPRRYTFEEWAWYLGLIGEDEREPDTHGKPKPHRHMHNKKKKKHRHGGAKKGRYRDKSQPQNSEEVHGEASDDEQLKWSWVGSRSPLVGGKEESEWILERLMDRLKELLWETKMAAEESATEET